MTAERLQFADLALAGVGNCTALRVLDLSWCKALESLPNSKCPACSLNAINVQSECCRELTCLLAAIGELKSLEKLVLQGCTKLETLPEGNQIDCTN